MIEAHNAQNDKTWFMTLNKFSDMTPEEFKRGLGVKTNQAENVEEAPLLETGLLQQAAPVDWRSMMNPIRDQGACGSCWAFAAVGALEGQYAIKNGGTKVAMSEQQMVDCDKQSYGCEGGWSDKALLYVQKTGGIMSRDSYPYKTVQGACRFDLSKVVAKVAGVYSIGDAKGALTYGPVVVYL